LATVSLLPRLEFSTAQKYLHTLAVRGQGSVRVSARGSGMRGRGRRTPTPPVWEDELYLEFITAATPLMQIKALNRRCEGLLYQAELFASLATLSAGVAYPKLICQLPGKKCCLTSFTTFYPVLRFPSFVEVNSSWQRWNNLGWRYCSTKSDRISSHPPSPPPAAYADAVAPPLPVLVFNSLNWSSSQVAVPLPAMPPDGQAGTFMTQGQQLLSQLSGINTLFLATDIPSVGYRVSPVLRKSHYPTKKAGRAPSLSP